jgi:vacuolar protein-sorting-associated protein 4
LQLAADESSKQEDVDLARLLACHDCASKLVQRLLLIEQQPVRLQGLRQLIVTLASHQSVLQDKMRQVHGASSSVCASEEQRRWGAVESMIVVPEDLTLSGCVGLEEARQLLREAVLLPHTFPHLFSGRRQPWRRILLYGPPGTGKTRLAHALASESKAVFYSISSADVLSSWVGESEKLIRDLFHHARRHPSQPVIVFIDEVDSLCRRRTLKEEDHSRRVKTELLKQMETGGKDSIFLLCATNCPWELDPAFLRRFQRKIFVGLPDREARCELLNLHLGSVGVSLSVKDLQMLAECTEGYSGSDIANVASEALLRPVRELEVVCPGPAGGEHLQPLLCDHSPHEVPQCWHCSCNLLFCRYYQEM